MKILAIDHALRAQATGWQLLCTFSLPNLAIITDLRSKVGEGCWDILHRDGLSPKGLNMPGTGSLRGLT
jgi:hypothetical protein